MMPDRTVVRAVRAGIRTAPASGQLTKNVRGNIRITPDELALAMELARTERIENDIQAYEARKAS